MKKILFAAMFAASMSVNAECVMSIAEGEVRIHPSELGGEITLPVSMNLDYRADNFNVLFTYPDGFAPRDLYNTRCMESGEDLTVTYTTYTGESLTYTPYLGIGEAGCSATAYIPVTGYYDYNEDGVFEPYGSAKWEAGFYADMFTIHFWIDEDFRNGYITMDGHFSSGYDRRGGTVGERLDFFKRIHVWVGYIKGDVDGNERIGIADVTTLVDYLLGAEELDEFRIAAADVNEDGEISIKDVTALIDYMV
jgi:hypothetical protein